jgi:hypothetical protein
MILLFIIVLLFLLKSGHLKNWKAYYPTILLLMIGDLALNLILYKHPLWHYKPAIIHSHTILDLFHAVVSFPCIVILFLGYMPDGLWKRAVYIVLVSAVYAAIEYGMYKVGVFEYFNGWNTFHSFLFDIALYSVVMIHYKKPLIAWLCIFLIVPLFLLIIQFPFNVLLE